MENKKLAKEWYIKASNQGNLDAKEKLETFPNK